MEVEGRSSAAPFELLEQFAGELKHDEADEEVEMASSGLIGDIDTFEQQLPASSKRSPPLRATRKVEQL